MAKNKVSKKIIKPTIKRSETRKGKISIQWVINPQDPAGPKIKKVIQE